MPLNDEVIRGFKAGRIFKVGRNTSAAAAQQQDGFQPGFNIIN